MFELSYNLCWVGMPCCSYLGYKHPVSSRGYSSSAIRTCSGTGRSMSLFAVPRTRSGLLSSQ